jgi:hypothetical protein
MAITLEVDTISAKVTKKGSERIEVPAGQWVHYRYGTPQNPTEALLTQVPAGKKWIVTMNVYIEELDA